MAKMKLTPLGDKVIVQPAKRESTTKSGIILPDTISNEQRQEGVVIAVGAGKVKEDGTIVPMNVKKGQRVLWSKYAPTEVEIEDEKYTIISESDILAIIE